MYIYCCISLILETISKAELSSPLENWKEKKMLFGSVGLATAVLALSSGLASAHGSHSNESPSSDWATRHMQGEWETVSI